MDPRLRGDDEAKNTPLHCDFPMMPRGRNSDESEASMTSALLAFLHHLSAFVVFAALIAPGLGY